MIRYLLALLLGISAAGVSAQRIVPEGTYSASFIGGESIRFTARDSFYFSGFYCTFGVKGKGRYDIRNDFLYLYFEKSKPASRPSLPSPIIDTIPAAGDSIDLIVRVLDVNGDSIPYATAEAEFDKLHRQTVSADENGLAHIRFARRQGTFLLTISAILSKPAGLRLDGRFDYRVVFYTEQTLPDKELTNGEVRVYEIDEMHNDLLLMRPDRPGEPFRRYVRQEER